MMDLHNIRVAVYCCIMLHNMFVVKRIDQNAEVVESASFYDVVKGESEDDSRVYDAASSLALPFVQMEEEHFNQWLLEVEYL